MLDQTSTTTEESPDAFTLFAQEPAADRHPNTAIKQSAAMLEPANTDVYKDTTGALRLKVSE